MGAGALVLLLAGQQQQLVTRSSVLWDEEFDCIFTASDGISEVIQCTWNCLRMIGLEMAL